MHLDLAFWFAEHKGFAEHDAHLKAQDAQVELGQGVPSLALHGAGAQEGIHILVKRDAVLLLRLRQAPQELCKRIVCQVSRFSLLTQVSRLHIVVKGVALASSGASETLEGALMDASQCPSC